MDFVYLKDILNKENYYNIGYLKDILLDIYLRNK